MAYLLGIDTGGTYTDAALLDESCTRVIAKAKSLTTRPDLAGGVGGVVGPGPARRRLRPGQRRL